MMLVEKNWETNHWRLWNNVVLIWSCIFWRLAFNDVIFIWFRVSENTKHVCFHNLILNYFRLHIDVIFIWSHIFKKILEEHSIHLVPHNDKCSLGVNMWIASSCFGNSMKHFLFQLLQVQHSSKRCKISFISTSLIWKMYEGIKKNKVRI